MWYIQDNVLYFIAGTAALTVLTFILTLIAMISNGTLKRRFKKWKGIHATADLDTVYERTVEEVAQLRAELAAAKVMVNDLQDQLRDKISTAKVMRYNAFAQTGSDLSFSVALLDDEKNGVVLSSIYGRDESRTYAKPILQGSSDYTLTEEEVAVVQADVSPAAQRRRVKV